MEDKEIEERMRSKINQTPYENLNTETIKEMDEHLREKEIEQLTAEAIAKKEMEERMKAKINGYDYSDEIEKERMIRAYNKETYYSHEKDPHTSFKK